MKKNRTYGLIGKNIDYSFSQKYFSQKFENENLNYTYSNFDIKNLSQIKSILQNDRISGFNVTIPYKEDIIKFLDEIDEVATAIGAVNTIKKINNKNIGYNTDCIGFEKSLLSLINKKKPENVLILGSGGASKAIKYVLKNLKWQEIWDALYWRFIYKNQQFFKGNPRLSMMVITLNKMDKNKLEKHLNISENYLSNLK